MAFWADRPARLPHGQGNRHNFGRGNNNGAPNGDGAAPVVPLSPIWQIPSFSDIFRWNQPRNLQVILSNVAKYFKFNEFMASRRVSKGWNTQILADKKFQKLREGKLNGESWYKLGPTIDLENTFHWAQLELVHFKFHRNSTLFKNYWHVTCSQTLSTLILSNCSFECDAFIFLLDRCSVLNRLELHSTKLRDLSDVHTNPGKVPPAGSPCAFPPPSHRSPIQHLTFDSIYQFEQCFADYLLQRTTGQLRSLKISKCFVPTLLQGRPEPQLNQMYKEFQQNMFSFLQTSRQTLTKFVFDENAFQMWFFVNLGRKPADFLLVQELYLCLDAAEAKAGYDPLIQFMALSHPTVQKLTLRFLGYISSGTLAACLCTFKPTLRELRLLFSGTALAVSSEVLDISGALQGFQQLESLLVRDMKKVSSSDLTSVATGLKQAARGVATTRHGFRPPRPINFQGASNRLNSKLSPSFLSSLPRTLQKLCVEQCLFRYQYFNLAFPLSVQLAPGVMISALTNVQIRGPVLHSLEGIVKILTQHVPNVETLALPSCGLTDMELTGIPTLTDVIRRHLVALALIRNPARSPQDIRDAILEAEIDKDRSSLFMLRKLKYLNLSNNSISDICFYEAMRLPGLKTLEMTHCQRISNTGLQWLNMFCPNLEQLNVKNCRKITEPGIVRLVKDCKTIRRIYTTKEIAAREVHGPRRLPRRHTVPPGSLADQLISPNFRDIVSLKTEAVNLSPDDQDLPVFILY